MEKVGFPPFYNLMFLCDYLFWCYLFWCLFCAFADDPTLDDVGTGVRVHIRSYDGLEFSVTSSLYQENRDGEEEFSLPEIRETIRLHIPEKGPAWKYWVQKIQDEFDDQWIASRFRATNVKETRYFTYFPESEGQWSRGSIIPLYQWHENEGRHFFTFLGLDTTGLSLLELERVYLCSRQESVHIVGHL